uniref:EMI domain-containing protein n=1 Tax=Graphocephala atropunctata TaxID=36148 RepID=A0A1B6LTK2_9HEMI
MDVTKAVRAILLFCIVTKIIAVDVCKHEIIDKINKLNPRTECILETNSALGCITYYSATQRDRSPGVKCVEGYVEPPCNNSANAYVIVNYDNPSTASIQQGYKQYEEGKGYIKELGMKNKI